MGARTRGWLDYGRFLAVCHWKLIVAPLLLVVGLLAVWLGESWGVEAALGVVSVLGGGWLLAADLMETWVVRRRWYGQPYPLGVYKSFETTELYDGYRMLDVGEDLVLLSDAVNARLEGSRNPIILGPKAFGVHEPAARYEEFAVRHFGHGTVLFNDLKVRLATDLTAELLDAGDPVVLQRTTYYAGVATNELAGIKIRSAPDGAVVFDGADLVARNNIISDLWDSDCSNHIGVSTIAFTVDGSIAIMPQSRVSAQSPGQDAPSGSGSLDYEDLATARSFQDLLRAGMARELFQEAVGNRVATTVQTRLIGYVRHLRRGGKPEFFGVSRLREHRSDLSVARGERVFHHAVDRERINMRSADTVVESVREIRLGPRDLSPHLFLNLLFLEHALARDGRALWAWLRGDE